MHWMVLHRPVELAALIGHVDWDSEAGVEKSLLLPTEDFGRERRADEKHQGQCPNIA
jgi:hypothetical protein